MDDTLLLINWQSQSKDAEIVFLVGFLLPPKEYALSTMGMNDGVGKLLSFFMGKQTLSYSAIPELTMRLFTISIYPKREILSMSK